MKTLYSGSHYAALALLNSEERDKILIRPLLFH